MQVLFAEGKSVKSFPIRMIYHPIEHYCEASPLQVGFVVPKRGFKLAVDRNHLKRLMREGYRLNKPYFTDKIGQRYIVMFVYMGNKELTSEQVHQKMKSLLQKFTDSIA
ncbi:MAG: ribonuclease P protein component [Flavobacteriaceae bacterium]|nr:MAG: ribonuclease P protein component [Flavobacteriaceae bacterium]